MSDVHLVGELENGASLFGESLIGRSPVRIRKIAIFPEACDPLPETLEAIAKADVITLGPGLSTPACYLTCWSLVSRRLFDSLRP